MINESPNPLISCDGCSRTIGLKQTRKANVHRPPAQLRLCPKCWDRFKLAKWMDPRIWASREPYHHF